MHRVVFLYKMSTLDNNSNNNVNKNEFSSDEWFQLSGIRELLDEQKATQLLEPLQQANTETLKKITIKGKVNNTLH